MLLFAGGGGGLSDIPRPAYDPMVPAGMGPPLPGAVDPYFGFRSMGPHVEIQDSNTHENSNA